MALEKSVKYLDLGQRIVAFSMSQSQKETPVVGFEYEPEITDFWNEYLKIKDKFQEKDINLTFNTLILKTIAEVMKSAPHLNAHIEYKYVGGVGKITTFDYVDITMPYQHDNGMLIPLVLHNVDTKNLSELSFDVEDLLQKYEVSPVVEALNDLSYEETVRDLFKGKVRDFIARILYSTYGNHKVARATKEEQKQYRKDVAAGKVLTRNDVGEGTMCVSNWGSLYKGFNGIPTTAPPVPPCVFTILMGAVKEKKELQLDEKGNVVEVTRMFLPMNLLFDHRIGGFGVLMPFVKRMDEILNSPEIINEW